MKDDIEQRNLDQAHQSLHILMFVMDLCRWRAARCFFFRYRSDALIPVQVVQVWCVLSDIQVWGKQERCGSSGVGGAATNLLGGVFDPPQAESSRLDRPLQATGRKTSTHPRTWGALLHVSGSLTFICKSKSRSSSSGLDRLLCVLWRMTWSCGSRKHLAAVLLSSWFWPLNAVLPDLLMHAAHPSSALRAIKQWTEQ